MFPEKRQAINYAQSRASFRSGEIRILDSSGGSCLSRRSSIQGRITKRLGSPYDSPLSTETAERSSRKSLARLHFGYVLDREDMNRLAFHRHPRDLVRTNSLWIVKHRRVKERTGQKKRILRASWRVRRAFRSAIRLSERASTGCDFAATCAGRRCG